MYSESVHASQSLISLSILAGALEDIYLVFSRDTDVGNGKEGHYCAILFLYHLKFFACKPWLKLGFNLSLNIYS